MLRAAVIGYGYWGPNLARNFVESSRWQLTAVSDLREVRLKSVETRYPGVRVTPDYGDLLSDPSIDAIAIATSVSTHYELAMRAIEAGKHVLVEKPLTASYIEGRRLVDAASRRGVVLLVDHTFVYTGAVRKMREMVEAGQLGDIYYYDSVRVNLGIFQHDVNVIWDLAVHDLSIMTYVLGLRPCGVSATGMSHVPSGIENIAYLTAFFEHNLMAHIHVNWLAPVKIRRTLLGGSKRMIVFDDLEPSEKIKIYDKGITLPDKSEDDYQLRIGYRSGDMWAPRLDITEALQVEVSHFADCIEHGARPLTGGPEGVEVVEILEAASDSLRGRGRLVPLPLAGVVGVGQ